MFCEHCVPEYSDKEPQIGKVIEVCEKSIKVAWLEGSYSKTWTLCKIKNGRNLIDWEEVIEKEYVLCPIQLDALGKLDNAIKNKLKSMYHKLKSS